MSDITITRIEPKEKPKHKLQVAAYARVSADKDAAFHSLESQTDYYLNYTKLHDDWELVGIYSDNAISGTIKERPEFQRLLSDCRAKKIDLVVTKSITRFARNTVVLLETIRELKALNIDVYFEKENMHSISSEGELLLTLLALYAEEEARSASENQRWRIKRKFERGQTTVGRMLGYRLVDSKLTIVPEEAEIVKQIYSDFISGKSINAITRKLSKADIKARFSDTWAPSTVRDILSNEKYTGNMILQKTYRPDFRTKKTHINNGQVRKYQVKDSHEAIISEEDFNKAQVILAENKKRQAEQSSRNNNADDKEPFIFSGLISCGICGYSYGRYYSGTGKYKHPVWSCRHFNELGKTFCASRQIPERILIEETVKVLEQNIPDLKDLPLPLTHSFLEERITKIIVPSPNHLTYHLKDGRTVEVEWKHHSRSESWTPEMKQKAREKTLARNRKKKEDDSIKTEGGN